MSTAGLPGHMRSLDGKHSQPDFTQVLLQLLIGNSCYVSDKVCGSTADQRSNMRGNVNAKDGFLFVTNMAEFTNFDLA